MSGGESDSAEGAPPSHLPLLSPACELELKWLRIHSSRLLCKSCYETTHFESTGVFVPGLAVLNVSAPATKWFNLRALALWARRRT